MSCTKFVAAVLLFASTTVQASQCTRGGECPSDDERRNDISLIQTKLQTNVIEALLQSKVRVGTVETSQEAAADEEAREATEAKAAEEARAAAEAKVAEQAKAAAEPKAAEEARETAEAKAAEEARAAAEAQAAEEAREPAKAKASEEANLLYVGVLSAPNNFFNRMSIRKGWLDHLRSNFPGTVRAEFIIGHTPLASNRHQGSVPSGEHGAIEKKLVEESKQFGDIMRIPLPETYQNLPDKTLQLLGIGVSFQYNFIAKIDDDQNFSFIRVEPFLRKQDPMSLLYAGYDFRDKLTYKGELGAEGKFVQYFRGPRYMLSFGLAYRICKLDLSHSAEYLTYGSSSEDVDMGWWVKWQDDNGQNVTVLKSIPM